MQALSEAGVEAYFADYRSNATTYYLPSGETHAVALQSQMDELTQRFVRLVREHEDIELQERDGQPVVQRLPTVRTGTKVGTGLFIDFTINVAALPC